MECLSSYYFYADGSSWRHPRSTLQWLEHQTHQIQEEISAQKTQTLAVINNTLDKVMFPSVCLCGKFCSVGDSSFRFSYCTFLLINLYLQRLCIIIPLVCMIIEFYTRIPEAVLIIMVTTVCIFLAAMLLGTCVHKHAIDHTELTCPGLFVC